MRIVSFDWDECNTSHIAEHGITPEEVEEACYNTPLILRGRWKRYYVLGQTDGGRYLTVVTEIRARGSARVITARQMTESERRRYLRR